MKDNLLSIIIVHWNTPHALRRQLEALKEEHSFEIIIVDNHSLEQLDWVNKEYSDITVIENEHNYGYAFACNQGAAQARGEWLLFLNPDVEIQNSSIHELVNKTEEKKWDAVSPYPGSENYQKPLPTLWSLMVEFSPLGKIIPLSLFKTKTLFGGCLLIKKYTLERIGGWDERFFLWFEDSDLTIRLKQGNYRFGWIEIPITHIGGSSFKGIDNDTKRQIFFLSLKLLTQKHFPPLQRIIIKIFLARFAENKLLPILDDSVCITVPNMRRELLDGFLAKNTLYQRNKYQLIIVTSALERRVLFSYKVKYPYVRFILLDNNKGFAKTVNIGFTASSGSWIGTVNDDTEASSDWVGECLKQVSQKTGSINPIIESSNGSIESAGITLFPYGKATPITNYDEDKSVVVTAATNGAAVLYQKKALEEVGLLDERFGSYLEDIDLSLRLTRAGYQNNVSIHTKIIHLKHQTSQTKTPTYKSWNDFKNWILIIIKNWSLQQIVRNFPQICIERLRNMSGIIKNVL